MCTHNVICIHNCNNMSLEESLQIVICLIFNYLSYRISDWFCLIWCELILVSVKKQKHLIYNYDFSIILYRQFFVHDKIYFLCYFPNCSQQFMNRKINLIPWTHIYPELLTKAKSVQTQNGLMWKCGILFLRLAQGLSHVDFAAETDSNKQPFSQMAFSSWSSRCKHDVSQTFT